MCPKTKNIIKIWQCNSDTKYETEWSYKNKTKIERENVQSNNVYTDKC